MYYIDPRYHHDDVRKDPTYKPPTHFRDGTTVTQRTSGHRVDQRLSKQSLIPRYNLRSQPTGSNQDQNVISQPVSNEICSTDANNNNTIQQVEPNATISREKPPDPMQDNQNIQTNRNTQVIDNEDNFISFTDNEEP